MIGMNTGFEGARRMHDTGVFRRFSLSNGISVWVQDSPIQLGYEGRVDVMFNHVGSMQDPVGYEGCAHFFEHIPFQGTRRFPDIAALTYPIEEVGGEVNASTGRFRTSFRTITAERYFKLGLEALVEMVRYPLIREEDVEKEKSSIKEEVREVFGDDRRLLSNLLIWNLFAGTTLDHAIFGDPESIDRVSAEVLRSFYDAHYGAVNMHIIVGGVFASRADLLDKLEEAFGDVEDGTVATVTYNAQSVVGDNRKLTLEGKGLSRPFQYVSFPMQVGSIEEEHAFRFLSYALRTGRDTPLLQEFRDKRQWTYRSGLCNFEMMHGGGAFHLECPFSNPAHFDEAATIFRELLSDLSPKYLKRRQKARQLARFGDFTNPIAACNGAISDIQMEGEIESQHSYEERCDAVTIDAVFAARDKLLAIDPFVLKVVS